MTDDDLPDVEILIARIGELEAENEQLLHDCLNASEETAYLKAENERLRGLVASTDEILRLCQNCHDDWLRAQDAAGVNLQAERDQRDGSGTMGGRSDDLVDTKALRRDLVDLMDRLCDVITDAEFEWVVDHIEKPTQCLICERDGHVVVDDMCGRPDHRFCITCEAPMPNCPLTEDDHA